MKSRKKLYLVIGAAGLVGIIALLVVVVGSMQQPTQKKNPIAGATVVPATPTPFMHRPFYGSQTVSQRTVSFVDHDKPWYVNDKIFVRYDGKRWDNTPIGSCSAGVNCYDGHNGYDLNMAFEPVLSSAAGKVIRAGWYNPLNHNDSLGLWVAIDHGNGYATAYGHLSSILVSAGDTVGVQWQIGTSGTTGSSTGPHLHFATYYLPYWQATDPFGWTGNYPDPNTVPDHYLWVSNSGTSGTIPNPGTSGNQPYPGAIVVDDSDSGWSGTGSWSTATAATDVHGNLHWTKTTSQAATATASWTPDLPANGYYEVAAYIDDNHAASSWAPYTISSTDPLKGTVIQHTVALDQSHIGLFAGPFGSVNTGTRWVGLGTYYFTKDQPGRVVLSNATGEDGVELSADAMEFLPVSIQAQQPATPAYRFAMTGNTIPATLAPGNTTNVSISIKNTGSATWLASGANRVTVGYRWQNSSGQSLDPALVGATSLVALKANVKPNVAVTATLNVHAPVIAGGYQLVYDLQYQGKWFTALGSSPALKALNVLPTLPRTYYFSEGYTGSGYQENLSLTNYAAGQANIAVTYYYSNATKQTRVYQMPPLSHRIIDVNSEAGSNQNVAMAVQGDQPFGAERLLQVQTGSLVALTDSLGSTTSAKNWYFAEANTTFGWNAMLAVLNPSSSAVNLTMKYQFLQNNKHPAVKTVTYTVPANSRTTISLNNAMPNQQFGLAITASSSVVVEKVEYLVKSPRRGGSAIVGAVAPQKTWYFGAGNTTAGFTEVLSLSNPLDKATSAKISYITTAGKTTTQTVTIQPQNSIQVSVNAGVKQALHSTSITAGGPIVVERQDFFNTSLVGPIAGSTGTIGSNTTHASWYLANGDTSKGHNQSLAITNPNTSPTQVQVVYYRSSGSPIVKSYTIAANTRSTINVTADVGDGQSVGVALYATSSIVVEQTMLVNLGSVNGGYSSIAYGV